MDISKGLTPDTCPHLQLDRMERMSVYKMNFSSLSQLESSSKVRTAST